MLKSLRTALTPWIYGVILGDDFAVRPKKQLHQTTMKTKQHSKLILLTVGLASLSLTAMAEKGPKPHKPEKGILHFFAQEKMINQGVISNAAGRVDIHINSVSKGKPQELRIELQHLDANATYQLQALVGDDTNLTDVVEFTTDEEGNAHLDFRDKAAGKGSKQPVPAALNPITNVRELAVSDGTNEVLTADLTAPDKFEYFVKRDMSTNGVVASLQIESHANKAKLRVTASGLDAGADYSLSLNGRVVTTATADEHGKLKVGWELDNPLDILSLQNVSLLNASSETVASVDLP
jgi:hypothetical protein